MSHEPQTIVPCLTCNDTVTMSLSWYRRQTQNHTAIRCKLCKTFDTLEPDDDDLRFWLNAYGVRPKGTATDHVAQHGLPEELVRLLGVISPA